MTLGRLDSFITDLETPLETLRCQSRVSKVPLELDFDDVSDILAALCSNAVNEYIILSSATHRLRSLSHPGARNDEHTDCRLEDAPSGDHLAEECHEEESVQRDGPGQEDPHLRRAGKDFEDICAEHAVGFVQPVKEGGSPPRQHSEGRESQKCATDAEGETGDRVRIAHKRREDERVCAEGRGDDQMPRLEIARLRETQDAALVRPAGSESKAVPIRLRQAPEQRGRCRSNDLENHQYVR